LPPRRRVREGSAHHSCIFLLNTPWSRLASPNDCLLQIITIFAEWGYSCRVVDLIEYMAKAEVKAK
jgi:glyceraldehyde-3-phosphate dehydrogenase/erythrose-4-phosphate dehydrogenase